MPEPRFTRLVAGEFPACVRCGSPKTSVFPHRDVLLMGENGAVCRGCLSAAENLALGRRLAAGLEERADELREQWLGADLRDAFYVARFGSRRWRRLQRRAEKRGPKPPELEELLATLDMVQETNERIMLDMQLDEVFPRGREEQER